MVLKNRSRVEILYDIIAAAKPYGKKTHLMYKGNLSYQQLDLYLNFILKNGLLDERIVDEIKLYFITQKGIEFMKLFEAMHKLLVSRKEDLKEGDSTPVANLNEEIKPFQSRGFAY
ncbi:MAG: winged helix-turn-helix domain-containing protein [Nitrososphaerales archaeon]